MNDKEVLSKRRIGVISTVVGPSWLFLPDLRLLIGDGVGFLDSVREAPTRIDDWVLPGAMTPCSELDRALMFDVRDRRVRWSLPTVHRAAFVRSSHVDPRLINGFRVGQVEVSSDGSIAWTTTVAREPVMEYRLGVKLRDEFRLTFDNASLRGNVVVGRRVRALKSEYRQKMEELGLEYEPGSGIGSRPKRPVGGKRLLRPANEHAFAVWASEKKEAFVAGRRRELIEDPNARPADFDEVMDFAKRSRDAEVARGKLDGNGDLHVPLTQKQLIERAAGTIARGEASQSMFDIRYDPAIIYDHAGRVIIL